MGEFQSLSLSGEEHGVIANHVAPADCMHADFRSCPLADHALTSMPDIGLIRQASHLREDLGEPTGGSAGRILLKAMVGLNDFEVKVRT